MQLNLWAIQILDPIEVSIIETIQHIEKLF